MPDSTREYFEKNGIDPSDYGWVGSLTSQNVFSHILEFLKSGAKTPLKSGAAITAVILISAAFSSAEIKSSAVQTAIYAAVTAAAAIIAGPVYASIKAGVDAVGIGGELNKLGEEGKFEEITAVCEQYIAKLNEARGC